MKLPVVIRVYRDGRVIDVKQFTEQQISIGAQDGCQLILQDDQVSAVHALIEERDTGFYLCDLGSKTGTFVGDEKILDGQISSGAQINIGPFTLEFFVGIPKPKAPPAPQPTAPPATASAPPEPVKIAPPEPETVVSAPPVAPIIGAGVISTAPPPPPPPVPETTQPSIEPDLEPTLSSINEPMELTAPTFEASPAVDTTPIEDEPQTQIKAPPPPLETPPAVPLETISVEPDSFVVVDTQVMTAPKAVEVQPKIPQNIPEFVPPQPLSNYNIGVPETGVSEVKRQNREKKKGRWGKTFAPPSMVADLGAIVRPSRGNIVEVVTSWKERALQTYHFDQKQTITVGPSEANDIVLPLFPNTQASYPILKLGTQAIIFLRLDMPGELRRDNARSSFSELLAQNRLSSQPGGMYALALEQGEVIRLDYPNEVSLYIRYVNSAPKPAAAPALDFTQSELTGLVMSLVLIGILGFYFALYAPPLNPDQLQNNQPLRTAVFLYKPPKPEAEPPPQPVKPQPVHKQKAIVKRHVIKRHVVHHIALRKTKRPVRAQTKHKQGRVAEAPKRPTRRHAPHVLTSVHHGGAIKVSQHRGSNMKSVQHKVDIRKTGLLGVFGSKGTQSELSRAYNGHGALQGLANQASNYAGMNANRPGDDLGSRYKDTGRGGNGTSTVGIAGVGLGGKGLGAEGYGIGGLGKKGRVTVIPGGNEAQFIGTIDRDAIKRVVMSHLREIRYCYAKQLNRTPDLAGKVVIRWKIGPSGRVSAASVVSSSIGPAVASCLVARLRTWRFPTPPANDVPIVTYPFLFQRE